MMALSETYALAIKYHQLGDFRKAEQLYREILQAEPTHGHTLHLLGLVALQTDRTELAAEYIGQAVRLQPDNCEAHNNLGVALKGQGTRPARGGG
jgi:Tfp pilus assembly protein PilF